MHANPNTDCWVDDTRDNYNFTSGRKTLNIMSYICPREINHNL